MRHAASLLRRSSVLSSLRPRARTDGGRSLLDALLVAAAISLAPAAAHARGPYVTLRDDGTLAGKITSPDAVVKWVMKRYDATGAKRPDVISLWTSFPQNENQIETLFAPVMNDVTGIGLENVYGDPGTFEGDYGPLRAVLLHNDVGAMKKRAELVHAPVEGYAEYLFLLELSHVWGPNAYVPDGDALVGFPFHWSFWMDAGGSPAGGNVWKDNGDGTFDALPQKPGEMTYSMLDLYLMGLADPGEVAPFGLLENAEPPSDVKDPFTGRALSRSSFPVFGPEPVRVKATRRTFTIADIVSANGPRMPARNDAPHALGLGIVLVTAEDATESDVAAAEAEMDALAPKLAPAFARATRGRGSLEVVTTAPEPEPEAREPGAPAAAEPGASSSAADEGGCTAAAPSRAPSWWWSIALGAFGAAALLRRGKRPPR